MQGPQILSYSVPQNILNPSCLYDFHCVYCNQSDEYLQSLPQKWAE